MAQRVFPTLTPEERAHLMQIQDRLIDLFVDRGDALANGDRVHAEALQSEIDDLMRQREDVRLWAVAGAI